MKKLYHVLFTDKFRMVTIMDNNLDEVAKFSLLEN